MSEWMKCPKCGGKESPVYEKSPCSTCGGHGMICPKVDMNYRIKITYTTGDSFHTEEGLETTLEEVYTTLERATEVLNRIKDHYLFVTTNSEYNRGWYFRDKKRKEEMEKIIEEAKTKPWYVEDKYGIYASIKLLLDNGTTWQMHTFWYDGTFDFLDSAEIIAELPKFKV